ncbi:MAG: hypothetical protein ACRD2I_01970 [Vicinamibacterales bacterium]
MSNTRVRSIVGALVSLLTVASTAAAQRGSQQPQTLVDVVREATAPFVDPEVAITAGYVPKTFCVSGPNEGAMGVHFVNPLLVPDGKLDPQKPEALVYESRNGRLRLVAAEFIVFKADWEAQGNKQPPALFGQLLNFIAAPNRFGNPDFYEVHVWAWKDNPFGTFVDWNPRVSCADHSPGD